MKPAGSTLLWIIAALSLAAVVAFAGIDSPQSDEPVAVDADAPYGDTTPDGRGGLYIADRMSDDLWYILGDHYYRVDADEQIFQLTTAGDGRVYGFGLNHLWRLDGARAVKLERGRDGFRPASDSDRFERVDPDEL